MLKLESSMVDCLTVILPNQICVDVLFMFYYQFGIDEKEDNELLEP